MLSTQDTLVRLPEPVRDSFQAIKAIYGPDSIARVEAMINDTQSDRVHWQEQAKWVMPGLSTSGWLDKNSYSALTPVINKLESAGKEIKEEFLRLQQHHPELFSGYQHYLVQDKGWNALYLYKNGRPIVPAVNGENQLPITWQIMRKELKNWLCPLLEMHFSILAPHTSIKPHCDLWNFTLNLHLAIDIPTGCGIKVCDETREWQEGECLLFDYSYLHEAWNHSDNQRVCLLMDIWHPETSVAERLALTAFIDILRKM